MPITCPISFRCLDQQEFGRLSYAVMPHIFASQNELGNLADESVYQADIIARLQSAEFTMEREVPVTSRFDTFSKTYYLDLVINAEAIFELKTVARLLPEHDAQLRNYLLLLDLHHGELVNLRPASVESRFVNSTTKRSQRQHFMVESKSWTGDAAIMQWIVEMLRDWGTGLELALYHQAIVHHLGGDAATIQELPMNRAGIALGNQRFYMMDDHASFRLTAFEEPSPAYRQQLLQLITHSPVSAVHWINIAYEKVTFTTVQRCTIGG